MIQFSLTIDDKVRHFKVAKGYGDLTGKGQLALLQIAYCQPKMLESRLAAFRLCSDLPDELLGHLCQEQFQGELQRLLEQIEWAWTSGISQRPTGKFRVRTTNYMLPDEELRQVGTGEFITAIAYVIAFTSSGGSATQKAQMLDCFLATICRPERTVAQRLKGGKAPENGDRRAAFSSYSVENRARQFQSMSMALKVAILQWFLGAVGKMEQLYGMPQPDPDEQNTGINLGTFVRDWETTVHELATAGSFGGYDAVMERSIHDVMGWLEIRKIDADKRQNQKG